VEKILVCTAVLALTACQSRESPASGAAPAASSLPSEQDQKALYMLGVSLVREHADLHLTEEELPYVEAGMTDQLLEDKRATVLRLDTVGVDALRTRRAAAFAAVEKQKAQPFLEQAAKEQGVVKTDSGLLFRSLAEGTGPAPAETDTVRMHFHARLADGTEFDSSYKSGQPAEVQLDSVSPCWKQGVLRMKVGGKAKLVCPSDLTYGDRGIEYKVPGGAPAVYELELLEILPRPAGLAGSAPPPAE